MRRLSMLLIIPLAVLACSSMRVVVEPHRNLTETAETLQVSIRGENVEPVVIERLERFVRANLVIAGFKIDSDGEARLEVEVHTFRAGNAGLRATIGLGAGRGSLLYTARYLDRNGKVVAEMEGSERFTGAEPHFEFQYGTTIFSGAEKAQMVLVREAAKHIVALGEGRL